MYAAHGVEWVGVMVLSPGKKPRVLHSESTIDPNVFEMPVDYCKADKR